MGFTERAALAFAIEPIYGTPPTGYDPGDSRASIPSADEIVIYDAFNPTQADLEVIELNPATGDLGPSDFISGRKLYTSEFTIHPFGSGAGATVPHWMHLLRVCGFRQVAVAGAAPTAPTTSPSSGGLFYAGKYRYGIATLTEPAIAGNSWAMTALVLAAADTTVTSNQKVTVSFGAAGAGKQTAIFRSLIHATAAVGPWFLVGTAGAAATSFIDDHTHDTHLGPPYPGDETAISAPLTDAAVWFVPATAFTVTNTPIHYESASSCTWLNINADDATGLNTAFVHLSSGVRGTITQMQAVSGNPARITFQLRGTFNDPVAEGMRIIGARSTPPKFQSAGVFIRPEDIAAIGKFTSVFSPCVKQITLTTGTQLTERRCANDENAIAEIGITRKFQPRFGINFESDADYNVLKAMGNDLYSMSGATIGQAVGRRIQVRVPRMRYQASPPYGDADGYRIHDANWVPGSGGGEDWMSFLHY
jgi:hypothetical protein